MENNVCLTWKEKALSMFGWTTKRYKGISIAYIAMLFVTFPLIEILVIFQNKDRFTSDGVINMAALNVVGVLFVFVTIVFTTIFSIVIFSYMHNKRCVDLFGSLPVSRRTLFFTRYISVLAQTIVPVVLIGTMGALLTLKSEYFISSMKMVAMLVLGITGIVSFIAALSLCCGTVVDVIVSFLVINGVYPICILICNMFPASILPGFGIEDNMSFSLYTLLSPMFAPFAGIWENEKNLYIVWWIVFSAILIGVCYVLSKKRKSETAQNAFVFIIVEQIIKFFSGFTVGFGMGWIFAQIGGNSNESYKSQYVWFFVGLCIGAFLTATILHLIYHRGVSNIISSLLIGAVDVVVAAIFVVIIITGAFGYDKRVPDIQDVQAVSVTLDGQGSYHVNGNDIRKNYINNKDLIKNTIEAHKKIVKKEISVKQGTYPMDRNIRVADDEGIYIAGEVIISYQLKNGDIINREYIGNYTEEEVGKLSKGLTYYNGLIEELKKVPIDEVRNIEIGAKKDVQIQITDTVEKIRKIKDAVVKDYETLGEERVKLESKIYTLYFYCSNSREESLNIKIPITENCKNTMKILDTEYKNIELIYLEQMLMFSEEGYSKVNSNKKTVYFRLPENWDGNAEVSAMLYDYEADEFSSDGLMDTRNTCKKVRDNLWAYTYWEPEDIDLDSNVYTRILFYQVLEDKVNLTGCIKMPHNTKEKCLVLGKKKKVSIDDYDEAMYKYQWEKFK